MQVRFLPGLQIRGAMHLSGKTASSRKRRGGFLFKTEDKVHFFNRGYLCGLHFSNPWFFPFCISGPAWA